MDIAMQEDYRIVLFGDSIAKGVFFNNEKGRYEALDNSYLSGRLKGALINAGKFGSTLVKGTTRLAKEVLSKDPDMVLLEFGGNDCDFDWDSIEKDPAADHKPKTELADFKTALVQMIARLKEKGIKPFVMTLPPLVPERYLSWLSKESESRYKKILSWLGTVSKIYFWHEGYNTVIREVAEETGTELIDIRSEFLKKQDIGNLMSKDGIHPNREGYKLIADKIVDFFKSKYSYITSEGNQSIASMGLHTFIRRLENIV